MMHCECAALELRAVSVCDEAAKRLMIYHTCRQRPTVIFASPNLLDIAFLEHISTGESVAAHMLCKSPEESSIFTAPKWSGTKCCAVSFACSLRILHALVHSQMSNELWPLPSGTNNLYNTHMTSKRDIAFGKFNAFDVFHLPDMHYTQWNYCYFVGSFETKQQQQQQTMQRTRSRAFHDRAKH